MKKMFTRWLTLCLLLFATVVTNGQTNVLAEDFESNALPEGWTQTGSVWQFANSCAVFKTDQNVADTLVLPVLDLTTPVEETQIILSYALLPYEGTSIADTLSILWKKQADDEWQTLLQLSDVKKNQTQTSVLLPAVAQGNKVLIALSARPAFAGGIQVDNVNITNRLVAECNYIPEFEEVTEITSSSATLAWVAPDADNLEFSHLKVSTRQLADPGVEEADIYDNAELENFDFSFADKGIVLSANTTYYVYLQYICTESVGGPWVEQSFKTTCSILSGEVLQEDFEAELSTCWTLVPSTGSSDIVGVSSSYAYEGSSSYVFSTASGKFAYLYIPYISGNLSDYQLSFYAATDDGTVNRSITIGASAAPDGVDFKEGPSYSLPSAHRWVKITCLLKSLEGKGGYIAFRGGDANASNKVYIDNVRLEPAQECLAPIFVRASEIGDKSAKLSWTESAGANAWNVIVSPTALSNAQLSDEDFVAELDELYETTQNPYTVTGLTPSTTYYVYVNSSCQGALLWSEEFSFKTAKEITFPYSEKFDKYDAEFYTDDRYAVPLGWVVGGRTVDTDEEYSYNSGKTTSTGWAYVSTSEDAGGSNYVSASLQLSGLSTRVAYAMLPAMPNDAPALNECLLEFDVHSSNIDGKIVIGVSEEQTWDKGAGQMFKNEGANFTAIDTISLTTEASSGWQHIALNLEKYAGTGKFLTFRTLPAASTFAPYVDNISLVKAPTCFNVQNLAAVAESISTIALSWNEIGKATEWEVKVSSVELSDMSASADMYDQIVSVQSATINGLSKNTTYYVYVRANCEESEWQGTTVTTPDALTLPVFYDFTSGVNASGTAGTGTAYHPANWVTGNFQSTTATYGAYVTTTAWTGAPADIVKNSLELNGYLALRRASSTNSIYVNARTAYAVLPQFTGSKAKDMVMQFYAYVNNATTATYTYYLDKLWIGVSNTQNPSSVSDIKKICQIELDEAKKPKFFNLKLSDYVSTDEEYLVLLAEVPEPVDSDWPTTNTTWYKCAQYYIDNLFIGLSSSPCPITGLTAEPTSDGAVLSWTENGNATQWDIKVYDSSILNPSVEGAAPVKEVTATSKPYTLTGLDMSKMYYVYVAAQTGSETGNYAGTSFKTTCGSITLPWFESFNYVGATTAYDATNKWLTPCISYANGVGNPTLATATGTSFGSTVCPDHIMGQGLTEIPAESRYVAATNPNHYIVKFQAGSTASSKLMQIDLPEMPAQLNTLQLTFYLAPYSSYHCAVRVGVQTDTEFIPVQNIVGATGQWTECVVNFSSLSDDVEGKIAIRADYDFFKNTEGYGFGTSYTGGFVDDILVEAIPTCAKVTQISVNNIDSVSAAITWQPATYETQWNLKVSSVAMNDLTETADVFDGVVSDTPQKGLTGLEELTTYYVYVQSVRPAEGCAGDWSDAVTFKTLTKAKPLPYFNGFEEEPEGVITNTDAQIIYVPSGFMTCGEENSMIFMYQQNGGATLAQPLGTYGMHMKTSKDKANYLVLPPFQTDDIKKLQLEFYTNTAKLTNPDYNYFDVGVMYDPTDPSTYSSVLPAEKDSARRVYGYFSFNNDSTWWIKHIFTFENYVPENENKVGHYIAIRPMEAHALSNGALSAGNFYLDNITVKLRDTEELIEPFAVWAKNRAREENGTTDKATISWQMTHNEGISFRVRLLKGGLGDVDNDAAVVDTVVTAADYVDVAGLLPNTVYAAYVRAEKEGKQSVWSEPLVFRTTVESAPASSLPYKEDFEYPYMENVTAPTVATGCGWTIVNATGALSTTTAYQKGGSVSLNLAKGAQLMTPALSVADWKKATISMDVRNQGSSATAAYQTELSVYLATTNNAEGVTNAELLRTITLLGGAGFVKVIIPVGDVLESVQEFKYVYLTTSNYTTTIDNFLITTETSFPVDNLTLNDFGDTWAAFSFDEYTAGVEEWVVEYGESGFALGEGIQKNISATSDTLTGLTADTSYDIYVRAVSYDGWTGPISVHLVKAAHGIPYYTGFEDAEDNALWEFNNNLNLKTYHNAFIIGDAAQVGGTGEKALFISDDGENYHYYKPDGFGTVRARRTIEIDAPGSYTFYMRIKSNGLYDGDAPAVLLVPASARFTGGSSSGIKTLSNNSISYVSDSESNPSYVLIPYNGTSGNNQRVFHTDGEWVEVVEKKDITKAGTYQLYILWNWYMQGELGEPVAIDSISIEDYECTESKNVKLTAVSGNSASFSWYGGKLKNFEVVVSPYKKLSNPFEIAEEDLISHETITSGPTYTISGLQPNTEYAFYVRSICVGAPTDTFKEYDFVTACEAYGVPFTELFGETPECWTLSQGVAATSHAVKTPEMQLSGASDKYNYLSIPKDGYAILPLLDAPINNLDIKMEVWNVTSTASYPIYVGVVSAPNSMDDFETLYTYQMRNTNSTYGSYLYIDSEEFEFYTNSYSGTGNFLVIKGNSQATVGVKSIQITQLPSCVPATKVEITQIEENQATVNWQTNGGSAWNIYYDDGTGEESIYVTEQPYTLTGLLSGTDYTVSVQTVCGENETSNKSVPATFRTLCGVYDLPLLEDFSTLPALSAVQINCWENIVLNIPVNDVFNGASIYNGNYNISEQSQNSTYYPSRSWHNADFWHNWMDNTQQICSWDNGGEYNKTNTKWLITPQYAITDDAQLLFDITYLYHPLQGDNTDPNKISSSRLLVLVSTDNAQSWKQADATEIDLTAYGIEPKKAVVDMSKFKGQNVRIALCHEINYTLSTNLFLFIDNIGLMTGTEQNYTDNICAGLAYSGYGFNISAEELKVGQTNVFERVAGNNITTLTLEVEPIARTEKTINVCEGDIYSNNGLTYASNNIFYENAYNEEGCLEQRHTTLVFNPVVTNEKGNKEISLSELPYSDGIITLDENTEIGVIDTLVQVQGQTCEWDHYIITVKDVTTNLSELNGNAGSLALMPNPAESGSLVRIENNIANMQMLSVRIYNFAGALVQTATPTQSLELYAPMQSGMYTVVLENATQKYVGKLIVK